MKTVVNESLVRRNTRIAQFSGLAGLMVLLVGMYLLFTRPNDYALIWGSVLGGFILSQVGIYFTNRYGRKPAMYEQINAALKGLSDSYSIYHYKTPTSHLLVGPAGVWVLLPFYQRGTVTFEKGRWKQRGGGIFHNYMKIFGQESLGRVDIAIEGDVEAVRRYLAKRLPENEVPDIQAAVIFTHPEVELADVDAAPSPTVLPRKLKDVIRKNAKTTHLPPEQVETIQQAIEGA